MLMGSTPRGRAPHDDDDLEQYRTSSVCGYNGSDDGPAPPAVGTAAAAVGWAPGRPWSCMPVLSSLTTCARSLTLPPPARPMK